MSNEQGCGQDHQCRCPDKDTDKTTDQNTDKRVVKREGPLRSTDVRKEG